MTLRTALTAAGACLADEITLYGRPALVAVCQAVTQDACKATLERIRLAVADTHGQTVRSWHLDHDAALWRGRIHLLTHSAIVLEIIAERAAANRREAA